MEKNISKLHQMHYDFKVLELKNDKRTNLLEFIFTEIIIYILIAFSTYNVCNFFVKKDWFFMIANIILIIFDICLVFWWLKIYERKKEKYRQRAILLEELYSGKYEDILNRCDDLESELHTLEMETAVNLAKTLEEKNEKVDLHNIVRW